MNVLSVHHQPGYKANNHVPRQHIIMVHVVPAKDARDGLNVRLWQRDVAGPAVSGLTAASDH